MRSSSTSQTTTLAPEYKPRKVSDIKWVTRFSFQNEPHQTRGRVCSPGLASHVVKGLLLLAPFVFTSMIPLIAEDNGGDDSNVQVLYSGPLVHNQNWRIKAGPRGPENQLFRDFGGTCSMVPADVSNDTDDSVERVTFEARSQGLGVWRITWLDTVSGEATDGNHYAYEQRLDYIGITKNGESPAPSHAMPTPGGGSSFLQHVPDNVTADALDFDDFFLLISPSGGVVASSHVRSTQRLQIPPVSQDPPPSFFPRVLPGGYKFDTHVQLAGQFGCDPL